MPKDYATWAFRWRVPLGFVLAAVYLILAQPSVALLLSGAALALAGLLFRAWSAGYLAKNQRLATGGPYSYTRNPLYLGSAVMGLGGAVAGRSWIMGAAFAAFFLLVYWPVMEREAQFLQREFPGAFEPYARQVPLFFPKLPRSAAASEKFQWGLYLKNREYEAAMGYVAAMLFLALKMWLRKN
jgi:protein-S-isoprenylcysteine O-methyltransferase Ste14